MKNLIIAVLALVFVSMASLFAYNEYQHHNDVVHLNKKIQLVYGEIYELENSWRLRSFNEII